MGQVTTGLRSILSLPIVYNAFQYLMGAKKGKKFFVLNYMKPSNGDNILDIGCGPAEILNYLPEVNYWGFDISEIYIAKAKSKFQRFGTFCCKNLTVQDLGNLPEFDIVIATGVLHHLDDVEAKKLVCLAYKALKPGGRFVTVDPCLQKGQNPVARFLIKLDRGQNVRNHKAYVDLVSSIFQKIDTEVRHRAWIPYTHCYMECTRE